jgi:hypothetical protein
MPYFIFHGHDIENGAAIRAETRPEHQVYIRAQHEGCSLVAGGPLTADSGTPMIGTLLILDAEDRAAVERFLAGDPYAKAGLFTKTELLHWQWGFGAPQKPE